MSFDFKKSALQVLMALSLTVATTALAAPRTAIPRMAITEAHHDTATDELTISDVNFGIECMASAELGPRGLPAKGHLPRQDGLEGVSDAKQEDTAGRRRLDRGHGVDRLGAALRLERIRTFRSTSLGES